MMYLKIEDFVQDLYDRRPSWRQVQDFDELKNYMAVRMYLPDGTQEIGRVLWKDDGFFYVDCVDACVCIHDTHDIESDDVGFDIHYTNVEIIDDEEIIEKSKRLIWVDVGLDIPNGDFNIIPIDIPFREKDLLMKKFLNEKKDIIVRDYWLLANDPFEPSELFIYHQDEIKPIQSMTDKEIRFIHNVPKMLRARVFGV